MITPVKFILALLLVAVTVIGLSFVWPRLTAASRPRVLEQVRNFVLSTPVGPAVAEVLEVSDEAEIEPVNINQIAVAALGSAVGSAQNYTSNIVFRQITRLLANQIDSLSPEQKEELRQMVCVASETTPSGSIAPAP